MISSFRNSKILVIEDNKGDFVLIKDYLEEEMMSSEIIHVSTLKSAKLQLTSGEISFDVILLDLSLPDAKGEDLVIEIVELAGIAPVIVLTGFEDKSFGIKTLSLGASDYLLKDELNASYLKKTILYSIERLKTSNQLRSSEENYRNLFHLSPLPMWVCSLAGAEILSVNNAAIQHYGYSKKEFLEKSLADIEADNKSKPDEIKKHNYDKQLIGQYDDVQRHVKKNGDIIYVEIKNSRIKFDGKQASLILATDITAKLIAERNLQKSEEKLRQLNIELEERVNKRTHELTEANQQLEAFTYSVSHDLQAPARNIFSFAQLLQMESKDTLSEKGKIYLFNIMKSTEKMQDIVKNLLNFFKIGKTLVKKNLVNTNLIVNGICSEYRYNGSKEVQFKIDKLPAVYGDEFMLTQVFVNLISNAVKYSSKKDKPIICIQTETKNEEIVFRVNDNGTGFDMKFVNKLFNLFQRLHVQSEYDGTGVGLAIVKLIVEKHNGKVWAEGKPNIGATFYFSIPNHE
ncbi:MAG: PAS domain S-box protein [Chitinophagaceae bacterium]|nr:MAG: PAS domain S-box protein [Chitinophagaceae bacterium]